MRGQDREEAEQARRVTATVNFATATAQVAFTAALSTGDLISVVE